MTPGTVFRDCAECPEMVVIPVGNFTMGSPASEEGRWDSEGPQHTVHIYRSFAVGKYEVTFEEWGICSRDKVCSRRPEDEGWGRGRRPVINVSWQDAKQYVEWLSRKTGENYRLLSEAEWEYVARAGTTTGFYFGNSITPKQANYETKESYAGSPTALSQGKTVPVGSYAPNAFGLYDVHGNVLEWVEDCWNRNYNDTPSDGRAWTTGDGSERVLRGGSWNFSPWFMRSARRFPLASLLSSNAMGFRVARSD